MAAELTDEQSEYKRFGVYLSKTEDGYCIDMSADDLEDRRGVLIGEVSNVEGMGLLLDDKVAEFEVVGGQPRSLEFARTFLMSAGFMLVCYFSWDVCQIHIGASEATLASDLGIAHPQPADSSTSTEAK